MTDFRDPFPNFEEVPIDGEPRHSRARAIR